jgi:colicin import membrane protein
MSGKVYRSAYRMRKEKAGTKRGKARSEAAKAHEDAASLRGELEATKTQNAGLLAVLKPSPAIKGRSSPAKD